MKTATVKVRNGTIKLPKDFQRTWKQAEVYISGNQEVLTIQRLAVPSRSLKNMMDEVRQSAKRSGLIRKDTLIAVRAVRKN